MVKEFVRSKKMLLTICFTVIALVSIWSFFNFRLVAVPPGVTVDEAAFGYNAALLAKTGHDENGRLLPIFVQSIEGQDWRQPITQYTSALFFFVFGPSLYILRQVSLFFLLLTILFYFLALKKMEGVWFGIVGCLFLLTMPIIMIQSHLALDNIAPLPFIALWLYALISNQKKQSWVWLCIAGAALGLGFYTYKAMRLVTPVLAFISIWYLREGRWLLDKKMWHFKLTFREIGPFIAGGLPFALAIPLLEHFYPGAVFDQLKPTVVSYRQFFQTYLSAFDPSFLFVTGDSTPYHAVADYGALLLASLPLFIIGLFMAFRKKGVYLLAVLAFFASPMFFGTVNSIHRASRLLALIPFYALVCGLGYLTIWRMKQRLVRIIIVGLVTILLIINYTDFIRFYWFTYNDTVGENFSARSNDSYRMFALESKKRNLIPYIDDNIYRSEGQAAKFFEAAYFDRKLVRWFENVPTPKGSIVLSNMQKMPTMEKLDLPLPAYNILIRN